MYGPSTSAAAESGKPASAKPPYPPSAETPTQLGPPGIRFDFNQGARGLLPNRIQGSWRIRLQDLDTGNILFESENKGALVASSKRYYVRFGIDVWEVDEAGKQEPVLSHV